MTVAGGQCQIIALGAKIYLSHFHAAQKQATTMHMIDDRATTGSGRKTLNRASCRHPGSAAR
jgi:hypothetical protein